MTPDYKNVFILRDFLISTNQKSRSCVCWLIAYSNDHPSKANNSHVVVDRLVITFLEGCEWEKEPASQ
jgi:hypothetical protein